MKIDSFQGYVLYRNKEHIFIFDNYELKLIPNTYENMIECQNTICFESLTKPKKKSWLNELQLNGHCIDGTPVIFCIQDNPWFKDGVFSYKVKWLYINDLKFDENIKIKGINFLSQEIDCIYKIKDFVTDDFSLENGCYKEYQINIKTFEPKMLGNFRFSNYGVKIFGNMSFRKKYCSNEKLEVWSKLILELSRELKDLNKLYTLVLLQLNVIRLLTYRLNNTFDMIETYMYDEKGRNIRTGRFYFNYHCEIEKEYENIQHLITIENIPNIGMLYEMLLKEKIYLAHICKNSIERRTYGPSRILGIMIAFERLFAWQYGKDKIRSENHLALLKRIEKFLDNASEEICEGIYKKKDFNKIKKRITEPQVSYGDYLSYVIKEIPLCERYVQNIYEASNINTVINEINKRVNKFRNDMAHGNIDVGITINHIKDLKLLEVIIYTMILNNLELSEEEIIKKIMWLFNIKCF